MTTKTGVLALLVLALSASAVSAQRLHHHLAAQVPRPSYGDDARGTIIARATERAQHEPGVTNELAPDSRQTATGGPVGGVPGFSGK